MGVESNGMVVAASVDGKPVLAIFTEEVTNGAPLRQAELMLLPALHMIRCQQ